MNVSNSANENALQVMADLFGYDDGLAVVTDGSRSTLGQFGSRLNFLDNIEEAFLTVLGPWGGFGDLTDDIAGVMGGPLPQGTRLERQIEEIAVSIGELSAQRFMVGSLIEELLLVSPLPQNLLTLKAQNAWEVGGNAFDFIHAAVASANDGFHGIIFNDVLAEGLLGNGEAAGLRDALAAKDPEALKMVLAGLNISGQPNFVAAFLVVCGFIAQIYYSWNDREISFDSVGGGFLLLRGYADLWEDLQEALKTAYMKSLGAFNLSQVTEGAVTTLGVQANSYMEVGQPVRLPLAAPSFLADNFGTLPPSFSPITPGSEQTEVYYSSPWADPARIMLINFGALTLGGILAKR